MILTTVIGNYPKITENASLPSIRQAIHQHDEGRLIDADLEKVFQENTVRVIREQEALGIDIITDGQLLWEDIVTPLASKIEGFKINGLTRFFNNNVYYRQPVVVGKLLWKSPITVENFRFAKSKATHILKAVLPGPFTFAALSEDTFYHNERTLVLTLAEILNQEAKALEAAGATILQFDEPALVFHKEKALLAIEGLQKAMAGLKSKKGIRTYFGDLEGIFDSFLDTDMDFIGLDFVSSEGNRNLLKKKKKISKSLGAGCVDARNTRLENPKILKDFIQELVEKTPQLYVSPNCGLEFLPYASIAPKLSRLVEVVRQCNARGGVQ
ncbi:MAG: methylcobamide--CoM methyltransferase [Candidatus Omnitrophica bacterium]|nr:methylcobamide--CoM methyltransferase [Candidatus Omnitrophota bacterium]